MGSSLAPSEISIQIKFRKQRSNSGKFSKFAQVMKTTPAPLPAAEIVDAKELSRLYKSGGTDLICVLGPTASGKTRYAVELARKIDGEIISADSRQIYRGMDIGTGKDLSEYGDVPYHIIDILPAGTQYNVHDYQQDFHKAYEAIKSRGHIPILCGGTGLYISAVTRGYNWSGEKIPLSEAPEDFALKTFFIGTLVDRDERNRRIDRRLKSRLEEGMIEEIQELLKQGVPSERLISYGLEYKFVTLYLTGQLDRTQMQEQLATAIHQFAKRQMTWFRGMERSGIKIHWVEV